MENKIQSKTITNKIQKLIKISLKKNNCKEIN